VVFDIHRPAQHDQPAIAVDVELGIGMAFEILEPDAMTASPDQWIQRAEWLGGNVLEDKKTGHLQTMPKATTSG